MADVELPLPRGDLFKDLAKLLRGGSQGAQKVPERDTGHPQHSLRAEPVANQTVDVGSQQGGYVQLRIQQQGHARHRGHGLEHHDHVPGDGHAVPPDRFSELRREGHEVQPAQRLTMVFVEQHLQVAHEQAAIDARAGHPHLDQYIYQQLDVALHRGEEQHEELTGQLIADHSDLSEVDESDSGRRGDQDVAGVRVGVENADLEKLLQIQVDEPLGGLLAVKAVAVVGQHLVDAFPTDRFQRQDPFGGMRPDHLGDFDLFVRLKRFTQAGRRRRLVDEVQLAEQGLLEFRRQDRRVVRGGFGNPVAEKKEPPSAILDGLQTLASTALSMISPAGRWPRVGDDSMSEFFVLEDLRALEGTRFQGSVRFTDLLKPGMGETLRAAAWASPLLDMESTIRSAWRGAQSGLTVFRTSHAQLTYCAGPEHDLEFNSGHVHSDAGSFELEIAGQPVIIDSGTYLYGYDAEIRSHFRGAGAHNSLMIDGVDPMTPTETFRWLNVPRSKTVFWCEDPIPVVASVRECTDADANPFYHRRTIIWVAEAMWIIVDVVTPVGGSPGDERTIDVHFHLPVDAGVVSAADTSRATIARGRGPVLTLAGWSDSPYQQELLSDRADRRTWYSEYFGDLKYGTTIVGRVRPRGACVLVHAIHDGSRGSVAPAFEADGVRLEVTVDDERLVFEVETGESIRILKNGTALANDLDRHAG